MRIKNIEFGLVRDGNGKVVFIKWEKMKESCNCTIYGFLCFYLTLLSKDCYEIQDVK